MKIHPTAAQFPALPEDEFNDLVADIKAYGLREPIMLTADRSTIVEGINRYNACKAAGVSPRFKTLPKNYDDLDIKLYIVSANLIRRHLNPGQRAVLVQTIRPELEAAAKARQQAAGGNHKSVAPKSGQAKAKKTKKNQKDKSGRVETHLAKLAKVGHGTEAQAVYVLKHTPHLANYILTGKISLNDAYKQAHAAAKAASEPPPKQPTKTLLVLKTHLGEDVHYALPKAAATFNRTNEQVSWAAWTWNPVTGCLHGCKYCYAREMAEVRESYKTAYPVGFTPLFHHERLDAPSNSIVPAGIGIGSPLRRVFVCSMADLFGKWVPQEWIDRVLASCNKNPQWDYLFLTKFPRRYVGLDLPATAWIGTSVDEQKRVRLAEEAFREIKDVRVKWLSLEPLLAPLEFTDLSMFDWVVIGSQSATDQPNGSGGVVRMPEVAPPFEWVARLTAQAREAGCRVYHKPNLLGVPNPQCAGMQLVQEAPILPNGKGKELDAQLSLLEQ